MFKRITLKNFQCHKNTTLPLTPGINLITGTSDHGKSTITRAFRWAILNLPDKDAGLKNEDAADTDEFSVSLLLDNDVEVTRFKNNTTNGYKISTQKEPLKAIGKTGVPKEIQDIFNMSSINIQEQHNPYFLLNDKASTVAAAFNEMIGLSVMDECVEESKIEINNAKAALKASEVEVQRIANDIANIIDTNAIETSVALLDKLHARYDELDIQNADMNNIIDTYNRCHMSVTANAPLIIECDVKIASLEVLFARFVELQTKHEVMSDVITTYQDINTAILNTVIPVVDFEYIDTLIAQCDTLATTTEDMNDIVTQYVQLNKQVNDNKQLVDTHQTTLDELLQQYTDCPLCGSILNN